MPPAISKKANARVTKTTTRTKRPNAMGSRTAPVAESDEALSDENESTDGEYQTAQEDGEIQQLFLQIKANSAKKRTANRTKRERKYEADIAALRDEVVKLTPANEAAVRQRTKDAVTKLTACLKRRSELERTYMDAVEEVRKTYLRFSGELTLTMKGRMDTVDEVDLISADP